MIITYLCKITLYINSMNMEGSYLCMLNQSEEVPIFKGNFKYEF